jgi:hypothetical protein
MDPLAGLVPAEPELPDADDDGDADELGVDDADCADVVCAVVDVAALLLDASATPVPPAPSPAATTPVMMSRRVRPPDLETIVVLPSRLPSRIAMARRQGPACAVVLPGGRNRTLSTV